VLEFRRKNSFRVSPPSKDEIPIMEEILLFPNYCNFVSRRRVLHIRLQTNPVSLNPIYSWNKTAKILNTSVTKVQRWHSAALEEVIFKAPRDRVSFVSNYFADVEILNI
jgi:hypothetical protein